jgi:hypothetical protein
LRFGAWNWVGIGAGGALLLLDIVALFLPAK